MGSKVKLRKRRRRTMKGGEPANNIKLEQNPANNPVPISNPPVTTSQQAELEEKSKAVSDAEKKVEV